MKTFNQLFERYPSSNLSKDGTHWQSKRANSKGAWVTVGKGANIENPYPEKKNLWWVIQSFDNDSRFTAEEFTTESKAKIYAVKLMRG